MAHSLEHTIIPGTLQKSSDAWANDSNNLSNLGLLLGRWRTLSEASGGTSTMALSTIYPFIASSVAMNAAAANDPLHFITIRSGDLSISGMTTQLRMVLIASVGTAAINATVTVVMYPFTVGGSPTIAITPGTVLSGSTASLGFAAATNTILASASAAFSLPSNDVYVFGATTGTAFTTVGPVNFVAKLQYRWV